MHKLWANKSNQFVLEMKMTHPAVQIYIWICVALLAQILQGYLLLVDNL